MDGEKRKRKALLKESRCALAGASMQSIIIIEGAIPTEKVIRLSA